MSNDYFSVGYDEIDKEVEEQRKRAEENREIREFWINASDEKQNPAFVRFLTEEPVELERHSIYFNGRWNRFTCTGDPETCILCQAGVDKRREGGHLLIDRRTFTTRDGKEYSDEIKYLSFVAKHVKRFRDDASELNNGKLLGEWKMKRSGGGSDTAYAIYPQETKPLTDEEKAKHKEILKKYIPEWNKFKEARGLPDFPLPNFVVAKLLKPLSPEEMQKIVEEHVASKGAKEKSAPSSSDVSDGDIDDSDFEF